MVLFARQIYLVFYHILVFFLIIGIFLYDMIIFSNVNFSSSLIIGK